MPIRKTLHPILRALTAGVAGMLCLALPARAQTHAEIAFHYAPVHFQATDGALAGSDFLTAFDYDGNLVADDNWDHLGDGYWPATVYYSVVQSCTHWFVTYGFYYPRSWALGSSVDTEHENDFEGVMLSVRKDGTAWGRLEGMLTVVPTVGRVAAGRATDAAPSAEISDSKSVFDFYSYTPPGSPYDTGHETVDGRIYFQGDDGNQRPMTGATPRSHAVRAWPNASEFNGGPDQVGVVYWPTLGTPGVPASGNDGWVRYGLVDLMAPGGLWQAAIHDALQPGGAGATFTEFGTFRGNATGGCGDWRARRSVCVLDDGHAPWGWDDHDDGATYRGESALDPAHLFAWYFSGTGDFSQQYVDNAYVRDLHDAGFDARHPPAGLASQLDVDALYARLVQGCGR